jgi:hypothetical protein
MVRINFNDVEGSREFEPIPDGTYLCMIEEVKEKFTRKGDEMWNICFRIQEGAYEEQCIYDNLVFSDAALKRARLFFSSIGVDTSGQLEVTPDEVEGQRCLVSVTTEEYTDGNGRRRRRNKVPFKGYRRAKPAKPKEDDFAEAPF